MHFSELKGPEDHASFACEQCGRIEEVSSLLLQPLKREVSDQTGFDVRLVRVDVAGRCRACRERDRTDLETKRDER